MELFNSNIHLAMSSFSDRTPFANSLWETSKDDIIQVDDVRIQPMRIVFENAYEGKHFEQIITIQNCGKSTAFVRVGQPSSFALELGPVLPRGEYVPPGLILKRSLKYVFSELVPVNYATIPYYINKKEIMQKVKVKVLSSQLSCDRYLVDFGEIDIGLTPSSQSFKLTNVGSKPEKFAIDIGQNEMKLIVNPVKGNIQAHSSVVFLIEAICIIAGKFDAEIWIKSQQPIRIRLIGEAKAGNLEICNKDMILGNSFNVVDFPRTYYGAKSVIRIILKNNSASRGVFCTLAKMQKTVMQIEEATRIDAAFTNFQLIPPEGRIGPKEAVIITATFLPVLKTKLPYISNEDDHRFAIYHIKKLSFCKDIYVNDYEGGLYSTMTNVQHLNNIVDKNGILPFPETEPIMTFEPHYHTVSDQHFLHSIMDNASKLDTDLNICLHGDVEQPKVMTTPNEIIILNMRVNEPQTRTIQFKNLSAHLPIFLSYKKMPFIEIRPKFFGLKPLQNIMVVVIVTPANFGKVKCNVDMELLFYNQPRHDFHGYVPVGQVSIAMKFTTPAVTTNKHDTIPNVSGSFPPNRISNKEFVQSNPVITRVSENCPANKTTSVGLTKPKSYSTMAMEKKRKAVKTKLNKLPEYEVSAKGDCCRGSFKSAISLTHDNLLLNGICPLTPNEMNNVSIEPRNLNIGRVAAYSKITKSFKVVNKNDIPISISIVPDKQRFFFPDGNSKRIEPRQIIDVPFYFFSEFEGLHSLCVRIVVNQNHIYDMTMQAEVVPRSLTLDTDRVRLDQNGPMFGYIDLKNTLNIPLAFKWDLTNSSCIVLPRQGSVRAGKDMTCVVEFNENKAIPTLQDISLITEELVKCRMYVATKTPKIKLDLSARNIMFGDVSVNQLASKCLVLKNNSNIALEYVISNPTPVDGMTIRPKAGRIPRRGVVILKIMLQAKRSIDIDVNVNLIFNETDYLQFTVTGHILSPRVVIKPTSIHFQKIPTSSYDTAEFCVYNKGHVASTIKFPSRKLRDEWRVLKNLNDNEPVMDGVEIAPNTSVKLYIQYCPMNVTNHWFYLPVIINNCLGDVDEVYALPSRIKLRDMTRAYNSVPNLKLFNMAHEPTFEISKLKCNFLYYPYNPDKCCLTNQISILNVSANAIKFCLRIDQLKSIFRLAVASDHEYALQEKHSIVFVLEPNYEIFLTASYHPDGAGNSACRVPIYIQDDYRQGVHNNILLNGYYQEPLMETKKIVYFGMLPLNIHVQKQIVLQKTYHNATECKVTYEVLGSTNLSVVLQTRSKKDDKNSCGSEDLVTINYTNCKVDCSFGQIVLKCSCHCRCDIEVIGCMENSIMTNYGYLHYIINAGNLTISNCSSAPEEDEVFSITVLEEVSPFPYFPDTLFENHQTFEEAIGAIEDWVFDFGSFGMARHLIPDSLRYITPPTDQELANNEVYIPVVTYLELLEVLGGDKVVEGFSTRCSVEPIARASTLRCLYANILKFLLTGGGNAPHVSPEFLLDYEEYILYKNQKSEKGGDILSLDDFNSISKQSWLDLLLQTLKVFIIARIKERPISDSDDPTDSVKEESSIKPHQSSTVQLDNFNYKATTINQNYFSTEESLLLKWLEYHYFTNILSLCPSLGHVSQRKFDNFNLALADSTALATVIIRYCPYLKEELDNLYWKPILAEENFHNAAKVLQTLMKVNSCFTIRPEQICSGHDIKKLLFVAYLYEFLPTLEPIKTIECKALLSQSVHVRVTIRNDSEAQVEYKAVLFGDNKNVFQLKQLAYVVEPYKVANVEVTYVAKYAKLMFCTLLLSGEVNQKRMAGSVCYKLVGIPDISYMTSTFSTYIELYSMKYFTIEVKSPYNNVGTFEIFQTHGEPSDVTSLEIVPLSDKIEDNQYRKLTSFVSYLSFDGDGLANWTLLAMAFTMLTKVTYFYLHNDVIGDFALKIIVQTEECHRYEELEINLPSDIHKRHCICSISPNVSCLRYLKIKIPRTNFLLKKFFFDAYYEMCMNTHLSLDLFNSPNGHRIISHLFKVNTPKSRDLIMLQDILTKPAIFNVKLLGGSREHIQFPKTFRIEHVDTSGTDIMLFHINGKLKDGLMLHLISQGGEEIRIYKLKFGHKKQYKKIDNI